MPANFHDYPLPNNPFISFDFEPVLLREDQYYDPFPVEALEEGEFGFVHLDGLWVPHQDNRLFINLEDEVLEEAFVGETAITDFARIINFMGHYVIDIAHVNSFLVKTQEPEHSFERMSEIDTAELMEVSAPVVHLIENADDMVFFSMAFDEAYPGNPPFEPIEYFLPASVEVHLKTDE